MRIQRQVSMRLTLDGSREELAILFTLVRRHACAGDTQQCQLTGLLYLALRDHVRELTMGPCDALTRHAAALADTVEAFG